MLRKELREQGLSDEEEDEEAADAEEPGVEAED
jgi:hypothetical protein